MNNTYTILGSCSEKDYNETMRQLSLLDKPIPVNKVSSHPTVMKPFEYVPKRLAKYGYRSYGHNETELVFNDCLPGKAWVKAHYQDIIPEPTMVLVIEGRTHKINGDYKRGLIKNIIKGK